MPYMTAAKRAAGLGAAGTGTEHHHQVQVTSAALLVLIPLFVFTFGFALGRPYPEVLAYFHRPFPAIVAALTILVSMVHFRQGVQVLIEDYVGGSLRHWGIIAAICVCYALAAAGLFAVARLAFLDPVEATVIDATVIEVAPPVAVPLR